LNLLQPVQLRVEALGRRIDQMLTAEQRRIELRRLSYGIGLVLALGLAAVCLYYLTDRTLKLPPVLRVAATASLCVTLLFAAKRHVVAPLRSALRQHDVAIALERKFANLRQELVSAVELKAQLAAAADPKQLRNQSPEMIAELVSAAARDVERVDLRQLHSQKHAMRVWAAALGCAAVIGIGGMSQPHVALVFLRRMFGASDAYPRLTTLRMELPDDGTDFKVTRSAGRARVVLAQGSDLPVVVRAEGAVPREVWLDVTGGRGMLPQIATAARGADRFRHVFRRVSSDFSFHARGGDDDTGDLMVDVVVVKPPQVGTIRCLLAYPEYTGKPPAVQEGGSIEALQGTTVTLQVSAMSAVATAAAVFQESGERVDLTPTQVESDGGPVEVFQGSFMVQRTDRYHVDLLSPEGLRSPHPGTYPVLMVADLAPTGRILLPEDDVLNVVLPTGFLPLRVVMRDDFGVRVARADLTLGARDTVVATDLLAGTASAPPPGVETTATVLVPLATTAEAEGGVKVGQSIAITVVLADNRAPEPLETKLPSRTLHVVDLADLQRRVVSHFRRLRAEVERAGGLQRERLQRTQEVLQELGEGAADQEAALAALQTAHSRLQTIVANVHADLMRAFNVHLFNDPESSPNLDRTRESWVVYHRAHGETKAVASDFYRQLAALRASGSLGPLTKSTDQILGMLAISGRIADDLMPQTAQRMAAARAASSGSDATRPLGEARALQEQIGADLEALLARLDEWNDYQDVVSTTRALRDQQREVRARTEGLRK
jgi:hypothetical protein